MLTAAFALSPSRDAETSHTLRFAADTLAAEFAPYKLTEILLFFARYRAGRYDKSFAAFDVRRIGVAFRTGFLAERAETIAKCERRRAVQEIDARRFTPPEGYTSYTWYLHLKQLAARGDKEAAAQLLPPSKRQAQAYA